VPLKEKGEMFRKIPSVDRLLNSPELTKISSKYPRNLILRAINQVLGEVREEIQKNESPDDLKIGQVPKKIVDRLQMLNRPSLKPVINATGVIVHTNLGRSILADRVIKRFRPLSEGYSNLEYDLENGKRGSRYSHVEGILKEITSAEAAMVVNNNAAAVLISLDTLARGREVIVSRGQLVEIGGSFRVPDVMGKSGAKMVEVGTTNKTHIWDYEEKIGPDTALLLKVHQSNFQIVGFTEEVETSELMVLGKKYGVPIMEDLGSGCLVDLSKYGLLREPTVQEVLADGMDLVTFSGDKLLGGPQAGIILGRKDLVEAIKKNQLSRALRIDKLTLLALEETLTMYRDEIAAVNEIPTLQMICRSYDDLDKNAQKLTEMLAGPETENYSIERIDGHSRIGGGALPLQELPTRLLCLTPKKISAQEMEGWLRSYDPPIIVRIETDQVLLDMRTIQEKELKTVSQALKKLATI
jgi:L-seryl-tRNA(Ser) seleniumtransferase